MGGGGKTTTEASWMLRELRAQPAQDRAGLARAPSASIQGVSRAKEDATFGPLTPVDEAAPADGQHVSTPGVSSEDLLDLPHHRVGALERGGVGQLDVDEEIALVLGRARSRWARCGATVTGGAQEQQRTTARPSAGRCAARCAS